MSARDLVMAAAGSAGDSNLYSDDVFSAYTYTGNGSTQTINNGIDLAGKGGLVWIKERSSGTVAGHALFSSATGVNSFLQTQTTDALITNAGQSTVLNANGFSLTGDIFAATNFNGRTYASWTFRKAPKFFDVVTYTGNGAASRAISHSLGQTPGMVIVKNTGAASGWKVWHRSLSAGTLLELDQTFAARTQGYFPSAPDATTFTVSATPGGAANATSNTYVAYLFAHDPSADGIIQCGSFTGNGNSSGNLSVTLGWEPQYLLIKKTSGNIGSNESDWCVCDVMRGMPVGTTAGFLFLNTVASENSFAVMQPTATGFTILNNSSRLNEFGATYIYLAIRRPNKPPTTGTQVYNAIARTGTGTAATVAGVGFAPDAHIVQARGVGGYRPIWRDRLRSTANCLSSSGTTAEFLQAAPLAVTSFDMDGISVSSDGYNEVNQSGITYINHFFRRAPGFFDVVCYTGTGVARTVPHSLGVAPELMITKRRNLAENWYTVVTPFTSGHLMLDLTNAKSGFDIIGTNPTSSVFTITNITVNANGSTYVGYLFASKAGISKISSYVGNGSTQTINCGFSTGARFILIKRTDSAGDWYVWDTARGIVSANDPHLSLNTTAAEVTSNDSVDPDSTGFIVNQVAATNINVSAATYLYLAIA